MTSFLYPQKKTSPILPLQVKSEVNGEVAFYSLDFCYLCLSSSFSYCLCLELQTQLFRFFFITSLLVESVFLILLLSAFSYYYERVIDFLLLCLPLQDLVFSKDLSSVILSLNLLWTEDALNDTIFVDDESSAECTHVGAAIHLLFTINTECLNEF